MARDESTRFHRQELWILERATLLREGAEGPKTRRARASAPGIRRARPCASSGRTDSFQRPSVVLTAAPDASGVRIVATVAVLVSALAVAPSTASNVARLPSLISFNEPYQHQNGFGVIKPNGTGRRILSSDYSAWGCHPTED